MHLAPQRELLPCDHSFVLKLFVHVFVFALIPWQFFLSGACLHYISKTYEVEKGNTIYETKCYKWERQAFQCISLSLGLK